ncbi:radical SAM/SPASM domain-containing protein [Nonomuraea sp. NPDC049625]|uniref:radical SAM/SPASM domain-containing protein n=1 Tax=Nonomuraea sp. NPDC049625 TaxID=3155775 RepID=UPI00342B2A58
MEEPDTDFFENQRLAADDTSSAAVASLERQASLALSGAAEADRADLQEIVRYLRSGVAHNSEGRDLGVAKSSFSTTELRVAARLEPERRVPYLLYRYRFNAYPRKRHLARMPIMLAVEPTSVCNIKCVMCFQEDPALSRTRSMQGFMDLALYERIISEAADKGVGGIVLASRGEPLLHKQIVQFVRIAKDAGIIDVKLNTNATRLTEQMSRDLLASGLDTLVFSVDSAVKEQFEQIRVGAKFDRIVDNIERFHAIRAAEFPDAPTRTRISMVLLDRKQDTETAVEFWRGMVDEFAVRWAIPRLNIYDQGVHEGQRPCSLLWERLYIWWDGVVNTCDEDYLSKLQIGKLAVENGPTIEELWSGEAMRRYRATHAASRKASLLPCASCPGF